VTLLEVITWSPSDLELNTLPLREVMYVGKTDHIFMYKVVDSELTVTSQEQDFEVKKKRNERKKIEKK